MSKFAKVMLVVFVILYWVSPIDLFPGPIDDVIVTLMAVVIQRKKGSGVCGIKRDNIDGVLLDSRCFT